MAKIRFPGESAAYRAARDELLRAELALRDERERVAQLRRKLPPGGKVETDYVFREGPADPARNDPADFFDTRFSELFAEGKPNLIVINFMFGPDWDKGCPMCSMWADGYDAVQPHIDQTANLALVAKAELIKVRGWAATRGWSKLRLLSSHDNSFNEDYATEEGENQYPGVTVFRREPDGSIRHSYTTEGSLVLEHHRAMDLFTPVWNLLDLLPEGRADWFPRHAYD